MYCLSSSNLFSVHSLGAMLGCVSISQNTPSISEWYGSMVQAEALAYRYPPNRPYPLTRTPYLHVNFCFSFETNHPPDSEKPILWQISIMGSLQAAWFFVLGQSVIAQQYSSSAPLSTSIPSASLLPHCGYYDVYTYLHLRSAIPSLLPPEGLEQNYHTHAFVRTV